MKLIPLSKRSKKIAGKFFAMVDDEDYENLIKYTWTLATAGYTTGYINKKNILMHRFILNITDRKIQVDHIDHNRLNNQKSNIRTCIEIENHRNISSQKGSTSKYLGVSWDKDRRKWRAQIKAGGKRMYLGLFENEIDAAKRYDEYASIYFREFANLNIK